MMTSPLRSALVALLSAPLVHCSSNDASVGQGPLDDLPITQGGGNAGAGGTSDRDPPVEEETGYAGSASLGGAAGTGGNLPIAGHDDAGDPGGSGGTAGIAGGGGNAGIAGGGGVNGTAGFAGTAGAAPANVCELRADGYCSPHSLYACCRVQGGHYLWKPQEGCRTEIPSVKGTAMCAQMSYAAPPDDGDPCTYFPALSCLRRDRDDGVEIINAANHWTPEQLGAGWATCDLGEGEQVASLPACP